MVRLLEAVTEAMGLKSFSADQPSGRVGRGFETTVAEAIFAVLLVVVVNETEKMIADSLELTVGQVLGKYFSGRIGRD